MKKISLSLLIFRQYAQSALLSILTIEILLLLMYFGINAYIGRQTELTLKREVEAVVPDLVSQSAGAINANFSLIARQTKFFAESHVDLFTRPETLFVPGEQPSFARAANGSIHQTNLKDGSSLYIAATGKAGEREMLVAAKSAALNPLYRHMVRDTPNVVAAYINTPGDMNRLYPFMEKVWEQYPADLNMEDYNFYYLADAGHNPERKPVWTGVYLDPAGQGWMLSCVAPVYAGGVLEGVVGLDVTVEKIVSGILNMSLPWGASAFLADGNGMILAMPRKVETLLGLNELKSHVYSSAISKEQLKPEEFNLFKMPDPELAKGIRELYNSHKKLREIPSKSVTLFVATGIIPETGWRVFVVVKQSDVFESVERLARVSQLIGFLAVGVMVVFYIAFFLFLKNRARKMAADIAEPVAKLTRATADIGTGRGTAHIPPSGIVEIDQLTENFEKMSSELAQRSRELVEERVRTELKGKESELAYTRGLYESASGYLHNVGNAITRMESCMLDFNNVLRSTGQYPEVFRQLKEGGQAAPGMLQKFEEVLLGRALPVLRSTAAAIGRIKDSIKQTIAHQQAGFLAATRQAPVRIDLPALLADICGQFKEQYPAIVTGIAPGLEIIGHREPLRQGIENLVKNAIEASPEGGCVRVTCTAAEGGAVIEVKDEGAGISAENLPKVMSPGYTTKPDGHGLGLHSFAVFLSASGGRLTIESEGPGKGTIAKAEVKNAA